jgi:putative endonuclease
MFYVYVIQSESTKRYYTGFTADIEQRIGQHNAGVTKSTKNRGQWKLVYTEKHDSRAAAIARERFLKSGQGREQLPALIDSWHP